MVATFAKMLVLCLVEQLYHQLRSSKTQHLHSHNNKA